MSKYFDKNGKEITEGCSIKYPDGTIKKVYKTTDGFLGTDATNPFWIKMGKALPGQFGIYPFVYQEAETTEIVD